MGRVEMLRFKPRARQAAPVPAALSEGVDEATPVGTAGHKGEPDLLDILAAGQPPAFASDSRERIVFWNRGATELLGRSSDEALGRHCWEVIGGRDVFGNRFCYGNCPVRAAVRANEPVRGFELRMAANGNGPILTHVTILRIPSVRPDLYTIVHILQPVEESSRLARVLEGLGAIAVESGAPDAWDPATGAPPPPLTLREREVLQWVARGLQNKEIAQTLDLSLATVRNHIHNILEKLGVHSKLEAVSLAFRNGWVQEERAADAGERQPAEPVNGAWRSCLR